MRLGGNSIAHENHINSRAVVMQRKTRRAVQFEITEMSRDALQQQRLAKEFLATLVMDSDQWLSGDRRDSVRATTGTVGNNFVIADRSWRAKADHGELSRFQHTGHGP